MSNHFVTGLTCLVGLWLSSCQNYDFKINDAIVYTPKPLFSDFDVADSALSNCLHQAIADLKISSASDLKVLNCSSAGIKRLDGLAQFSALEQLKLSANEISNVDELASLSQLKALYLNDNRIADVLPVIQLPALTLLDVDGNTTLQCPDSSATAQFEQLLLPAHCR